MRRARRRECHTEEIRELLTIPKDYVSDGTLGTHSFRVSESVLHVNSPNHFIEFDPKRD